MCLRAHRTFTCGQPNCKGDSISLKSSIARFPFALLIIVHRVQWKNKQPKKVDDEIFVSRKLPVDSTNYTFDLAATVHHDGTAENGHYWTQRWNVGKAALKMDDSAVSLCALPAVKRDDVQSSSVCALLYLRQFGEPRHT